MDWTSVGMAAWLLILTVLVVRDRLEEKRRSRAIHRVLDEILEAMPLPPVRTAFDIPDVPRPDEFKILETNEGSTGLLHANPSGTATLPEGFNGVHL